MSPSQRPRRVPLLWILIPFSVGIALARLTGISFSLVPFSLICVGSAITAFLLARADKGNAALAFLSLSCLLAGTIRMEQATPQNQAPDYYVEREAFLEMEIERLFHIEETHRASGLAKITRAEPRFQWAIGLPIAFSLNTPDGLPRVGEHYQAKGVLSPLATDLGDRGFNAYLASLQIAFRYKQGRLLEKTTVAPRFDTLFQHSKDWVAKRLSDNQRPEGELTGAYQGLMLGEKGELSSEQKTLFLQNGTMHLFAISGLHIGIIALCIHNFLQLIRTPRKLIPLLCTLAVLQFVLTTGGSASSWRALLMLACLYSCQTFARQVSPINALILSACIYLLILPNELFQAGFQMSYLTVSSILLLGVPLGRNLNKALPAYPNIPHAARNRFQKAYAFSKTWLINATAVSAAAYLPSVFLGALYFQVVPVYGIPINVLALPMATLAIMAGFGSILSSLFGLDAISVLFNNAALLLIHGIQDLLAVFSALPKPSIEAPSTSAVFTTIALLSLLILTAIAYARCNARTALFWQGGVFLAGCGLSFIFL